MSLSDAWRNAVENPSCGCPTGERCAALPCIERAAYVSHGPSRHPANDLCSHCEGQR